MSQKHLFRKQLVGLGLALSVTGCSQTGVISSETAQSNNSTRQDSALRELKRKEALADFAQIEASFRSLYGPLERKQSRYGFDFDQAVRKTQRAIRRGTTDNAMIGAITRFTSGFRDGHVGFQVGINSDSSFGYSLPLLLQPFEDKYLVTAIAPDLASAKGITNGDELLAFDDARPTELANALLPYIGLPNPATARAQAGFFMTQRPWFIDEALVPEPGSLATLQFARADGSRYTVEIPWTANSLLPKRSPTPSASPARALGAAFDARASDWVAQVTQIEAEINKTGSAAPIYLTRQFVQTFQPTAVRPSDANLAAFNTPPCTGGGYACYRLFSALYSHQGKRILLTRVPSYVPGETSNPGTANALQYFEALLAEFQSQADVLIVDNTHNPGGAGDFATGLYQALLRTPGPGFGYQYNTDRRWIQTFRTGELELMSSADPAVRDLGKVLQTRTDAIELAYDRGLPLTAVQPFGFSDAILKPTENNWKKPFIVLADELSASSGDILPTLVKASKQGLIFGARTAGLGGNIENVLTTSATNGQLTLTRGLFVAIKPDGNYVDADFAEDNGVVPDVAYQLTVSDYRAGYVPYVRAFSDLAASLPPIEP